MYASQHMRFHRWLARWVLASFALVLGVSIAAPLIKPEIRTLLCTSAGQLREATVDSDGGSAPAGLVTLRSGLDCVLCLALDAPPTPSTDIAAGPYPAAVQRTDVRGWWPQHVHPARPGRGPPPAA